MNIRFTQVVRFYHATFAFVLALTCVRIATAQESTGQTKQAITGGPVVATLMQEELGLLTLTTPTAGCSASLLTNEWIITAAHCLNGSDLGTPSQVTLTGNWKNVQTRQAAEIRRLEFRVGLPDIALIRVANPFNVGGSTRHFRRELLANGMDDLVGYPIETYGRGINQLAQNSGGIAIPTQSDGQFRSAKTQISKIQRNLFWFPRNSSNQIVAGGDSGGPSFVITRTGRALAGVHALCSTFCLQGQTCTPQNWTWISAIPECGDAPIATVYEGISKIINESVASLARDPARPGDERGSSRVEGVGAIAGDTGLKDGAFDTSAPTPTVVSYIYAVREDGSLQYRRHDGAEQGTQLWQSPKLIGSGWETFRHVFTGGQNIIYAVNEAGDLLWYRHNTAYDVKLQNRRRQTELTGPLVVHKGWQNFRHVFSAGDGVIYAIDQNGDLLWFKHIQYKEAVEIPSGSNTSMVGAASRLNWARSWVDLKPRVVGKGWAEFRHVFPGGDGVIYVVTKDGRLLRYRHVGYLDGLGLESAGAWEGPVNINGGWDSYHHFFSRGDGIIYAVAANGELFWFRDRVPRKGGRAALGRPWYGPRKVDDGWANLVNVFALLPVSEPANVR